MIRILPALGLGMILGVERQLGQHPAGVRTNALVCLGAALFVSLSEVLEPGGKTRIAGQVVSGIGFICGGAILREGINVRGMNTAATLWCSAAIGTLSGLGHWAFAVLGTIAVLVAHLLFRPMAHWIDDYNQGKNETELLYEVNVICQRTGEASVRALLGEQFSTAKLRLQGMTQQDTTDPERIEMKITLFALKHDEKAMNALVARLAATPEVARVSWGKCL